MVAISWRIAIAKFVISFHWELIFEMDLFQFHLTKQNYPFSYNFSLPFFFSLKNSGVTNLKMSHSVQMSNHVWSEDFHGEDLQGRPRDEEKGNFQPKITSGLFQKPFRDGILKIELVT